jgi:hypothetical protein
MAWFGARLLLWGLCSLGCFGLEGILAEFIFLALGWRRSGSSTRLYVLLESNCLALGHIDSLDHLVVV